MPYGIHSASEICQARISSMLCNAPLGEKILGGMMASLSEKYKLSQRYTNHSIRVTSLQVLEDANIESRHIVRISGHKSIELIQNYARKSSTSRKRSISSIFTESVSKKQKLDVNPELDEQPTEEHSKQTSIAPSSTKDPVANNDQSANMSSRFSQIFPYICK